MAKHVSDSVLCPRCRGDLSSTEHQGQATCPHCKAPVLFAALLAGLAAGRAEK